MRALLKAEEAALFLTGSTLSAGPFPMEHAHCPDITFMVHPRPEVDSFTQPADQVSLLARPTTVPSITAAEDVSHHRDTFIGDLVFLARFAFGRY